MTVKIAKIAVLVSGSGTNLESLLRSDLSPGQIELVISNNPDAGALAKAQAAGVRTRVIDHRSLQPRSRFDAAVVACLQEFGIEWVILAGFMRVVTDVVLEAFPNRVVNIHPSLLPAFPGMDGPRQALQAGVKVAGCTVHLVDRGVDTGPILAQAAVAVWPTDTEEELKARILAQEHQILPAVVKALARGLLRRGPGGYYLESAQAEGVLQSGVKLE